MWAPRKAGTTQPSSKRTRAPSKISTGCRAERVSAALSQGRGVRSRSEGALRHTAHHRKAGLAHARHSRRRGYMRIRRYRRGRKGYFTAGYWRIVIDGVGHYSAARSAGGGRGSGHRASLGELIPYTSDARARTLRNCNCFEHWPPFVRTVLYGCIRCQRRATLTLPATPETTRSRHRKPSNSLNRFKNWHRITQFAFAAHGSTISRISISTCTPAR